jgi:uncharacterized protein YwqG
MRIGQLEKAKDDAYTLLDKDSYKNNSHHLLTILEYFIRAGDEDNFYKYLPLALKKFEDKPEQMYGKEFIKKVQNSPRFKAALERLETGEYDIPESLKEFEDEIRATEKEYIRIEFKKTDPTSDKNSKVGGKVFYFPENMEYPTDKEGNPLQFLAQINWAEVPRIEGFPESGLLQFFIDGDDMMMGLDRKNPTEQTGFKVIYHTDLKQKQADLMNILEKLPDSYSVFEKGCKESIMHFKKWKRPISSTDFRFGTVFPKMSNMVKDEYRKFMSGIDETSHKIGGYANFTQEDIRSYKKELQDYVLLFQIDSDYENGICWGDAGVGNFFIKPNDLAKLDFTKVLYNWDCS